MFPNVFAQVGETISRIADTQAYAAAQAAGGSMRIQPEKVDELARFFEDEAKEMEARERQLGRLADVPSAGSDPVSTNATPIYGQVASGGPTAYAENYHKLATVFKDAATALRASAKQVRSDDDTASLSFKS